MQLNGIRVYVAGPYTSPDPVQNTHIAIKAANELLDKGYTPFIPHLALLFHMVTPRPYDDWLALGFEWVKTCHAVLRLPGHSPGADKEVTLAGSLSIPVFETIDDLVSAFQDRPPTI